nr:hypothetical protein Cry52Nrm2_p054 [Cryptomonas curvata]
MNLFFVFFNNHDFEMFIINAFIDTIFKKLKIFRILRKKYIFKYLKMKYYLGKNKIGISMHGTIFYFLKVLIRKKNNQYFEKFLFDKDNRKKFNQYAKCSISNFEKKFFKNIFSKYIEEKKKIQNYMKNIFNYISDSNSISNDIFVENKKQEYNFKQKKNELFFKTGELDCFERNSKEILELDKENFYIKQNNLKIKKEINKDLTEKIKTHILNAFMIKKSIQSNQTTGLLDKKSDNIQFALEKTNNKRNVNETFFEKNKDRNKIITLLNHIFIKLNKLYTQRFKKRGCLKF